MAKPRGESGGVGGEPALDGLLAECAGLVVAEQTGLVVDVQGDRVELESVLPAVAGSELAGHRWRLPETSAARPVAQLARPRAACG